MKTKELNKIIDNNLELIELIDLLNNLESLCNATKRSLKKSKDLKEEMILNMIEVVGNSCDELFYYNAMLEREIAKGGR